MSFGFGFGFPRRLTSGGGLSPSLYLDFVGTGVLPSTVTFSRGTNATLTDSNGRVAWAPHNLLTNSEDFEAAAWIKSPLGVGVAPVVTANQAVAPDGSTTADLVVLSNTGTTTGDWSWLYQNFSAAASTAYTFSAWVRASGPAEIGKVIAIVGAIGAITLVTLTADWQRVTQTGTTVGAVTISVGPRLRGTETTATTASFFIWGAQLNVGALQSYNSTTPKNLLGFTQEPENAAWTKSNSYVQQNLLTWSQDFDNAAWTKDSSTVSANATTAPDGTTTADKVVSTAVTAQMGVNQGFTATVATYTASFSVKQAEVRYVQILWSGGTSTSYANFDLLTGTVTASSGGTATITAQANGFYRIALASALTTAGGFGVFLWMIPNGTAGRAATYTGNGTDGFFAWGAQLVQGSTAGDYTQTTSAAAPTRYLNFDGTLTGRKLVEDTAAATTHRILNSVGVTVPTNGAAANIVYAKAGERTAVRLTDNDIQGADFDLLTGAVSNIGSGVTAAATSVGGGWWRLSVIRTNSTGVGRVVLYLISGGTITYTGDGTSGIYVSDFQLSNSASVDPYVYNPQAAAASAAYYGPRFDYNPTTLAANGLLIEEQRTNLALRSQELNTSPWIIQSGATVTQNTNVAPDGTISANTVTGNGTNFSGANQSCVSTIGNTYTTSIYLKAGSLGFCGILVNGGNYSAWVNLSTGALSNVSGFITSSSSVSVGNGWYRVSLTCVVTGATHASIWIFPASASNSSTGSGSVFAWGAQIEEAAFATSYIPTVASQVTRNADSASMLGDNFYTWYNPNQGSFTFRGSPREDGSVSFYTTLLSASPGNTIANQIGFGASSSGSTLYSLAGSSSVIIGSLSSTPTAMKLAMGYAPNSLAGSKDGGAAVTTGTVTLPGGVDRLFIGGAVGAAGSPASINGVVQSIGYYNTRLPDSTLTALTT